MKGNFLSISVLQTESGSTSRKQKPENKSRAAVADSIELLKELRPALTSLAPQLARCLRRGLSHGGQGNDYDTVSLFKESAVLSLKCLTGILSMSSARDPIAQELVFDILSSVRFDDSELVTPSDPLTDEDIHVGAKQAFGQFRTKLREVSADHSENDLFREDDENSASLGMEGHVVFLAVLESLLEFCGGLRPSRVRKAFE